MDIEEIWPPYALHLQSGDMELSPVREDDLPELAELVRGGLRRNGVQAFLVDWDSGSDEQIARSLAQYHWGTRANFTVDDWTIEFTVRVSGRAVGVQGVTGRRFPPDTRGVHGFVAGPDGTGPRIRHTSKADRHRRLHRTLRRCAFRYRLYGRQ